MISRALARAVEGRAPVRCSSRPIKPISRSKASAARLEASGAPDLSVEFGEAAEASLEQADDFNLESEMSGGEAAGFDLNLDVAGDVDEEQMFGLDGDMVGEIDEVGTKLDLAQAYVDMGDSDGARNILNEVLTEGSNEQREEAQTLLTKLG